LKEAIEKHLWSPSERRFLRGLKTQAIPSSGEQARYMLLSDTTVDISILGLSIPFGVFPASDPRMQATAEAISKHLTSPVGGIYRYPGDTYRGGNPWIIGTLWLALQYIESGQGKKGSLLYNWALEHRTALDLFPEQIDRMKDKPCWVNPLGWSHAMFLLATEEAMQHDLL
jgi:GH15 family glucan-1,4-alpha-glucosidase